MIIFQKILAFLISLVIPFLPSASVIGYGGYTPIQATEREYCFDDEKLLLGGYNFNFNYLNETQVSYIKEAGLDFIVSGANETFLDYCAKYDIGVIAHGYNLASYWISYNPDNHLALTKEKYKDHEALWGDSLIDEPRSTHYSEIGAAVDHYYNTLEGKLPLVNLFPNYFNEDQAGKNYMQLTDFQKKLYINSCRTDFRNMVNFISAGSEELYNQFATVNASLSPYYDLYKQYVSDYISKVDTDIISVDYYPLGVNDETSAYWFSNLDILAEACRETGRKLWVITQAAGQSKDKANDARFCDTPEDIRYQMYVSIAFGAKAIIHACYSSGWWDSDSHMIDANGNRTDTYYAVQQVNKEVSSFADIYANYDYVGTFLTNPMGSDGADYYGYLSPISREDRGCTVTSKEDHILTGCFDSKDGNSEAFTFVNMNNTKNKARAIFDVTFDDATSVTVYRKGEVTNIEGNVLSMTLDNQEGIFVIANK